METLYDDATKVNVCSFVRLYNPKQLSLSSFFSGSVASREGRSEAAMEVWKIILRTVAKKIPWWQEAEIIGVANRQMQRWSKRYQALLLFIAFSL